MGRVDDVTPPEDDVVATAVTEDKVLDSEMAEDELEVGDQLEREAQRLIDEDDGKTTDSKATDSEKSDEEQEESHGSGDRLSAREVQLLSRLDRLEDENNRLRAQAEGRVAAAEEEAEEEDVEAIPYDAGEIDESLEGIRPALEANGKFLISQVRAAEKRAQQREVERDARLAEIEAEVVRTRFQVDQDEEDKIVNFAMKNHRSYTTKGELIELIKDYRNDKELKELRREKAEREAAAAKKPQRQANTRSRGVSRQAQEELEEEVGGDPYNKSWDRSVRKVFDKLRADTSILDRGAL